MPFNHDTTHLLVTLPPPLMVASYLIMSAIIVWSFMPFMNCSFSHLPISLYLHLFTFALRQLIYLSAVSSHCLHNLKHFSDTIIVLNCDLNFSFIVSNSPFTVWYASSSVTVTVCINWRPFLPRQFSIIFTFSGSLIGLS